MAEEREESRVQASPSSSVKKFKTDYIPAQEHEPVEPRSINSSQFQHEICTCSEDENSFNVESEKSGACDISNETVVVDSSSSDRPKCYVDEFEQLKQRERDLDNEIQKLNADIGKDNALSTNMEQLHEYNLIKDVTQIVIGHLSHILNVPVTELHEELNLNFEV